ncbi:MAG: formate dehydrogenase accessory sulfurtransferase FdhD [Polyangiaceae bacterium]|jgi:FdhD protein|nr:formate dehydrogenase accessory sulfurtransferase FdhD [Polyangiaceae bacterium]
MQTLRHIDGQTPSTVWVFGCDAAQDRNRHAGAQVDSLATEEPLQVHLSPPGMNLSVTMRTPGDDVDLVAGLLYAEGVVKSAADIERIEHCPKARGTPQQRNVVNVALRQGMLPNLEPLERRFLTSTACGVCGKTHLEALKLDYPPIRSSVTICAEVLYRLPERMRAAQHLFTATGGLHAAALFDLEGNLLRIREDVGRHNALDKLLGAALMANELPLGQRVVVVSGRSSYEILQKCISAGVPIVCAISAPTSLAVSLALEFGITLVGFLRGRRFNVYAHIQRIAPTARQEL